MAKISDVVLSGHTGRYTFEVYPTDTTFSPIGAVYVFTNRTVDANGTGSHTLLYIGQTDSLATRIPNHEKWPCAQRNGANCICIHADNGETSRINKETDLRAAHTTPCNDQ